MKLLVIAFACMVLPFLSTAQSNAPLNFKLPPMDKSPMDMTYYPVDYPLTKAQGKTPDPLIARVVYSRPQKEGRIIFGDLVEYGKVWRLGANEATEIEFYKDVTIEGKKVAKGRYTLYAIPNLTQWTIILNRDTDTWGAFVYDEKKDALRVFEPVQNAPAPVEAFTMTFTKTTTGMELTMAWDNVMVTLPVVVK
jgi:hypothetical protein